MKFTALFVLLLAGTAQSMAQVCPDAGAELAPYPDLSDIAGLIKGFNILPDGIPEEATIFLPTNAGVADFLSGIAPTLQAFLPGVDLTVENLVNFVNRTPAIQSLVQAKFTSALLYHIVVSGAFTPEELAAEGSVQTALGQAQNQDFPLLFAGTNTTGYTVTDMLGGVASVLDDPVPLCNSEVYIVDKVLAPAELLSIPNTTPEQAAAVLGAGAGTGTAMNM